MAVVLLLQRREPQHRRQRAADLIEHVDRPRLALAQLLDEHHALLQLRLPLLELLDLQDDRVQPRGFLLRVRDVDVELLRFAVERADSASRSTTSASTSTSEQAIVTFWPVWKVDFFFVRSRSTARRLMRIIGRPPF